METPAYFAEMAELFSLVPDRRSKLEHLIEIGEDLEYPTQRMTDENLVPGCVSKVWIAGDLKDDRMYYQGFADALIVRGFVQILVRGLSGHTPEEIVEEAPAHVRAFLDQTGLDVSLIESRANTFGNVFERMKRIAEVA